MNFVVAVIFRFTMAQLPVDILLGVALLLSVGAHLVYHFNGGEEINKYVFVAVLVFYFSYFVFAIGFVLCLHHVGFLLYEPGLVFSHTLPGKGSLYGHWETFFIHCVAVVIVLGPLSLQCFWSHRKMEDLNQAQLEMEKQKDLLQVTALSKESISQEIVAAL